MKKPIPTPNRPSAPLSPALSAGAFVFVSGQVGIDPATGDLAGLDAHNQTQQVITNLASLLVAAHLDLADVIKTTVFLTNASDIETMNDVYRARFPEPYPTRSTIVVKALARPDFLVEIEAVAVHPIYSPEP